MKVSSFVVLIIRKKLFCVKRVLFQHCQAFYLCFDESSNCVASDIWQSCLQNKTFILAQYNVVFSVCVRLSYEEINPYMLLAYCCAYEHLATVQSSCSIIVCSIIGINYFFKGMLWQDTILLTFSFQILQIQYSFSFGSRSHSVTDVICFVFPCFTLLFLLRTLAHRMLNYFCIEMLREDSYRNINSSGIIHKPAENI